FMKYICLCLSMISSQRFKLIEEQAFESEKRIVMKNNRILIIMILLTALFTVPAESAECEKFDITGMWKGARGQRFEIRQTGCRSVLLKDLDTNRVSGTGPITEVIEWGFELNGLPTGLSESYKKFLIGSQYNNFFRKDIDGLKGNEEALSFVKLKTKAHLEGPTKILFIDMELPKVGFLGSLLDYGVHAFKIKAAVRARVTGMVKSENERISNLEIHVERIQVQAFEVPPMLGSLPMTPVLHIVNAVLNHSLILGTLQDRLTR
ncbi:MAG: hypothetical protein AB7F59_12610, partial [Bdellovibrionales bacterium]